MDAGVRQRARLTMLVAGLSGAVIGLLVWSSPPAGSAPGDELLPDLRVEQPGEIYIAKGKKAVRLRTSNSVSNVGAGPLEIYSGDEDDLCGAGGVRTFQRIFEDTVNTPGYFNRKNPAEAESFETVDSGCSRYHPAHDHWHFDNFARYTLVRESNGAIVGKSKKVSFCVIDTGRPHPGLPGSPGESYYPQDPEGGNPQFPTCSATSVDGLSIGWEDTYGAALPGQGINITPGEVPAGEEAAGTVDFLLGIIPIHPGLATGGGQRPVHAVRRAAGRVRHPGARSYG